MEIEYIKANGVYYRPMKYGIQDPSKMEGCFYPEVKITKLWFGRWKIEGYKDSIYDDDNIIMIILFPAGIEEIRYKKTV